MNHVTTQPKERKLQTAEDVKVALRSLFDVGHFDTFMFIGDAECGPCYWFRLPADKKCRLARLDGEGHLHIYNLHQVLTRFR